LRELFGYPKLVYDEQLVNNINNSPWDLPFGACIYNHSQAQSRNNIGENLAAKFNTDGQFSGNIHLELVAQWTDEIFISGKTGIIDNTLKNKWFRFTKEEKKNHAETLKLDIARVHGCTAHAAKVGHVTQILSKTTKSVGCVIDYHDDTTCSGKDSFGNTIIFKYAVNLICQ
ncbi:hypothetical protein HMI55_005339, partial [Coelomomyces lativittatus]